MLAVAGLRHEAVDDAMERHVVIKALARQLLQPLGMLGRKVGVELDEDQPGAVSMISVFCGSAPAGSDAFGPFGISHGMAPVEVGCSNSKA